MGMRPYLELGVSSVQLSQLCSGLPLQVRDGSGTAQAQRCPRPKAAAYFKKRCKDCYSEVLTIVIFIKLVAL